MYVRIFAKIPQIVHTPYIRALPCGLAPPTPYPLFTFPCHHATALAQSSSWHCQLAMIVIQQKQLPSGCGRMCRCVQVCVSVCGEVCRCVWRCVQQQFAVSDSSSDIVDKLFASCSLLLLLLLAAQLVCAWTVSYIFEYELCHSNNGHSNNNSSNNTTAAMT